MNKRKCFLKQISEKQKDYKMTFCVQPSAFYVNKNDFKNDTNNVVRSDAKSDIITNDCCRDDTTTPRQKCLKASSQHFQRSKFNKVQVTFVFTV